MASTTPTPSSFSTETLRDFLWHDNIDTRKKFLELVTKDEVWLPKFNLSLPEQRDLAFKRLQLISKAKLFSVKDFSSNPRNIFTGTYRVALRGSFTAPFDPSFRALLISRP